MMLYNFGGAMGLQIRFWLSLLLLAQCIGVETTLAARAAEVSSATAWQENFTHGQAALNEQDLPQAEKSFRLALDQVQKQPHNTDELAKCLNRLADTLALRNKTAEAQSTYQKMLTVLEAKYGKNSSRIAPALIAIGSVQESEGDPAAAMPYYQRAFQLNEKNYGPYSPEIVSSFHRLARSTYKAGFREPAAKHYKRAMAILMKEPSLTASNQLPGLIGEYKDLIKGDDQSSQDLLKDFRQDMGEDKLKTPLAPDAVNQKQKLVSSWQSESTNKQDVGHSNQTDQEPKIVLRGLNQNYTAQALSPAYNTMNEAIFDQNHYGKGEAFYQRKIAADVQSLGNTHPSVANDISGLALFYIANKRYDDAEALLTRALEIYKNSYGLSNILTIRTMATLASVKSRQGKWADAEEFYRTALSQSQSALGPNNIETARVLNDLAFLYYSQDKLKDARTFYKWAIASTEGALGDHDPLLAACLKDYAQVLRSLGDETESLAAETRAQQILTK